MQHESRQAGIEPPDNFVQVLSNARLFDNIPHPQEHHGYPGGILFTRELLAISEAA